MAFPNDVPADAETPPDGELGAVPSTSSVLTGTSNDVHERMHATVEHTRFVKDGPTLQSVLHGEVDRNNLVSSFTRDAEYRKVERIFTEREGLENLDTFLQSVCDTAAEQGDDKILSLANALREKLVFIGEWELQEAIDGFARRAMDMAKSGKNVYLFCPTFRSEQYITIRILERIHELTVLEPDLRRHIRLSKNQYEIAQEVLKNPNQSTVIIPDDFAVSGSRIQGFAQEMIKGFLKAEISLEKAAPFIEIFLVAANKKHAGKFCVRQEDVSAPLRAFCHFGIPNTPEVFTQTAVTGSHSSVDYGFENPIEELHVFMQQCGKRIQLPLLHTIKRPYEYSMEKPGTYANRELQHTWENLLREYDLKS